MNKLKVFENNDTVKLFFLTKKLISNNFFDVFLNEFQYMVLKYIIELENFKVWKDFLEKNCVIKFIRNHENDKNEGRINLADTEILNEEASQKTMNTQINNVGIKRSHSILESDKYVRNQKNVSDLTSFFFDESYNMINFLSLDIRYLLWEKAIDYYFLINNEDRGLSTFFYNQGNKKFQHFFTNEKFELFNFEQEEKTWKNKLKIKVHKEEDNYDLFGDEFDYDSSTFEKKTHDKKDKNLNKFGFNFDYDEKSQLVIEIPLMHFKLVSTDVNNVINSSDFQSSENNYLNKNNDIVNNSILDGLFLSNSFSTLIENHENVKKKFRKLFHNFEHDKETLIKRKKLERSDLKLKNSSSFLNEKSQGVKCNQNENKFNFFDSMNVNLGFETQSLKFLFNAIQKNRNLISLSDYELKVLFMNVNKKRGKWFNTDRIGQEELYDACEKVVLDLRNFTEHSTPFLNKVSKREAPNYLSVIENPMDLNTVMKKLKNLCYNSKQEFVNDLMLIWSNCLTYNVDPKHYLRAHAIAMQKKTLKLISSISNIQIKNKYENDKEEEKENKTKIFNKGKGKGFYRNKNKILETSRENIVDDKESNVNIKTNDKIGSSHNDQSSRHLTNNINLVVEEEEENENTMNDFSDSENSFDIDFQVWKSLTSNSRFNYCMKRISLFFNKKFSLNINAKALIRNPEKMKKFEKFLNSIDINSNDNSLTNDDKIYFLEYDVIGGIPEIEYKGVDNDYMNKIEDVLMEYCLKNEDKSCFESGFLLSVKSGLNKIISENILEFQQIRKICFKISLFRQIKTQQFVHHTEMRPLKTERIKEKDVDLVSKFPNRNFFDKNVQFFVLRKNISKIAMQTGFESTENFAINTLTNIAEKHLNNLIKTIKLHLETNSQNKLNTKDILLISLLDNGINNLNDLYNYINQKLIKQQEKLKDLKKNLSSFFNSLLQPKLENFNENNFNDNSEQFVTGEFINDLGEDFFGFKDTGIDKEFNAFNFSVPSYLFHSKSNKTLSVSENRLKKHKFDDLNKFISKKLTLKNIGEQIKLTHSFYFDYHNRTKGYQIKNRKKKKDVTQSPNYDTSVLVEDTELSQKQKTIRPKVLFNGKISTSQKKIVKNSHFISDNIDM